PYSFPSPQDATGAVLDGGKLSLSTSGRLPTRWHRPLASSTGGYSRATPKTVTLSREAAGGDASCSCREGPVEPWPVTGRATGIDLGLTVLLVRADGEQVESPPILSSAKGTSRLAMPNLGCPLGSRAANAGGMLSPNAAGR